MSSSRLQDLLFLFVLHVAPVVAGNSVNAYGQNFFADSLNSTYDGYQQAWRYLGHMVKCGYPSSRYYEENSHSGSNEDDNRYRGNNYCQRYLIWAAYVDYGYSGGGIGEYAFYDSSGGGWDYSACENHGNGRCVKMDCHNTNSTTWTLLGVYKEASYFGNDAFFEQLFKHEGVCVWNDDDLYEFMSYARESSWPEGCVSASSGLYLDLKPTLNGNMSYGLYKDEICKTAYTGGSSTVDSVAKNMGLLYGSSLDTWNDALEVYKTCQPCRAYNLQNQYNANGNGYGYSNNYQKYSYGDDDDYAVNDDGVDDDDYGGGEYNDDDDGDDYYADDGGRRRKNRRRHLDGDYDPYNDPNEGWFQCADDADYTNVNQCMKFRSHADLEVATWEDLVVATEQGGILDIVIGSTQFGVPKMSVEEQIYMQQLRQAQMERAEREYRALVASVPSSKPVVMMGALSIAVGGMALATSIVWFCIKGKARPIRRGKTYIDPRAQPLDPNRQGVVA